MVRRGSTVRVRQRALQKRRTSALSRSGRLALDPACGGYGAVYGAFASTTPLRRRQPGGDLRQTNSWSYRRSLMGSLKPNAAPTLLAPLHIGDRLPWKLDGRGEPQWVTVIEVVSDVS